MHTKLLIKGTQNLFIGTINTIQLTNNTYLCSAKNPVYIFLYSLCLKFPSWLNSFKNSFSPIIVPNHKQYLTKWNTFDILNKNCPSMLFTLNRVKNNLILPLMNGTAKPEHIRTWPPMDMSTARMNSHWSKIDFFVVLRENLIR